LPDGAYLAKFRSLLTLSAATISTNDYEGVYAGSPVILDILNPAFVAELQQFDVLARMAHLGRVLFGVACTVERMEILQSFLLKFDVPRRRRIPSEVILRLSVQHPFYHKDNVLAEASAMMYVREATNGRVPVPLVYGWATNDSLLGAGFIIEDCIVRGTALQDCWDELSSEAQRRAIRDYARITYELSRLTFDRIGSIRLDSHGEYLIGPVQVDKFEPPLEGRDVAYEMRRFNRTFKRASDWLVNLELEENAHLGSWQDHGRATLPSYMDWDTTIDDSNDLLMQLILAIPVACEEADESLPSEVYSVCHPGMDGSNILIATEGSSPGEIVSVLDWKYAGAFPIWRLPQFPKLDVDQAQDHLPPDEQSEEFRNVFLEALQEFAGTDSILYRAADARWDTLRDLATTISLPWYRVKERQDWLREFERHEEEREVDLIVQ